MSQKINDKNLIELIKGSVQPITREMFGGLNDENALLDATDDEILKVNAVLNRVLQEMKSRSVVFSLENLQKKVYENKELPQVQKTNDILEEILVNYNKYNSDDEIICLGNPLMGIYTTRNQIEKEIELVELVSKKNPHVDYAIEEDLIQKVIKENPLISDQQKRATYACTFYNYRYSMVEGYAGAGKSFTMASVSKIYQSLGYVLRGITLSWKAAEVLKIETKMPCISMSSFISEKNKQIENKEDPFSNKEMIIVDEAGLIGLNQMLQFLKIVDASKHPVKVIFSGDTQQLEPIGEPNALELVRRVMGQDNHAIINEIRRQKSASHRNAVLLLKDGHSGKALYTYYQQEAIKFCNDAEHVKNKVLQDYLSAVKNNKDETNLIICYENKMVHDLNDRIRQIMINVGQVNDKTEIEIPIYREENGIRLNINKKFAVGDRIYFTQNDKKNFLYDKKTGEQLNIFLSNRLNGKISKISGNQYDGYDITVDIQIDKDKVAAVDINTKKYSYQNKCYIDYNYAITAYSSQGQTVDRVFLVDSKRIDRRNAYVLCSRHRDALQIYLNKSELVEDMIKAKKYQDEIDFENNGSTLSMLNHLSERWGRPSNQQSAIIKFLDAVDEIKEINARYRTHINLNNLDEDYLDKRMKLRSEMSKVRKNNTLIQSVSEFPILDNYEYYIKPSDKVDLEELRKIKNVYNENASGYDTIPLKDIKSYQVNDVIDEELFTELKGKYFDIGRGGKLNMICKIGEHVVSKYNVFGKDALQTGYPFLITPSANSLNKTVIICQDLNEMLNYMKEFYLNKESYRNNPTIIWGATDTNYKYIFNALNDKNIIMIGDEQFKKEQFYKITHSLRGYAIDTKFENFTRNDIDDELWSKIDRKQIEKVIFSHNNFKELSFIKTNYEANHVNKFIDNEGNISNDVLERFIIDEKLLTQETINNQVKPFRSYNRLSSNIISNRKPPTSNLTRNQF